MMHKILILFTWVPSHKNPIPLSTKDCLPVFGGVMALAVCCFITQQHKRSENSFALAQTSEISINFRTKDCCAYSLRRTMPRSNVWWQRWQCSHLSNDAGELSRSWQYIFFFAVRPDTLAHCFPMGRLSLCCDLAQIFQNILVAIICMCGLLHVCQISVADRLVSCECDCSWAVWQESMSYAFVSNGVMGLLMAVVLVLVCLLAMWMWDVDVDLCLVVFIVFVVFDFS